MSEQPVGREPNVIRDVALLDLSHASSAGDLAHIAAIEDVAMLLIPESLTGALTAIPMRNVAAVVPVPDGVRVRVHTGAMTTDGPGLAAPDGDVLVQTGPLVITSPVERVGYSRMIVTGLVLAPRGSEAALAAGLTRVTGVVAYYDLAEGQRVRMMEGTARMSGEALANRAGSPSDLLLVAGQLVVTGPVTEVGFQRIILAGLLLAPPESERILAPALEVIGATVWYTAPPRTFHGTDRFPKAFFELLPEPITLVLSGTFEIDPDVPASLVMEKVAALVLSGRVRAPREVVGALQALAVEKSGAIEVLEEGGGASGR